MSFLYQYLASKINKNSKCSKKARGFTVIELMVVIAIFAFVLGTLLFKQQGFESGVVLTNTAYEIALTIRQAQVYGSASVKVSGVSTGIEYDKFQRPYGVYFDTNTGLNKNFILYADADANQMWTGTSETVTSSSILRGNFVSDLCFTDGTGQHCKSAGTDYQKAYINFKRPNPEAIIKNAVGATATMLNIKLSSPSGTCRMVQVSSTGQISVKTSCS